MSNSLIMAIAGSLHQNIPSGGTTPSIVGTTSGHTTSGSTTIPLPSGCATGDYAVIAVAHGSSSTITPPSGTVDILADYIFYSTVNVAHIYGYVLTSTDITNGAVSFSATSTSNWYSMTVLHSSGTPSTDVIGTAATAIPNNTSPITCPANSVTTTGANEQVLAFGFAVPASATSITWTPPSSWTTQSQPSGINSYQIAAYSLAQASAGATGNASIGASASSNVRGCGIQIAFKG